MYKTKDPKGRPFTLVHCYLELEKFPKWQTRSSQKKQKKTSDASLGTTCTDDDIGAHTDDLETEKRPLGTKREKERRRKGKASASDGDGCSPKTSQIAITNFLQAARLVVSADRTYSSAPSAAIP